MDNLLYMSVSEAYAKSKTNELANEIWKYKYPGEDIDASNREYISWLNSLPHCLSCAHEAGLDNIYVIFEMKTPISNKAIDVLFIGRKESECRIVIIELKQWNRIYTENVYNPDKVYIPEIHATRKHPFKQLNLYENNLRNHHSGIQEARNKDITIKFAKIAYLHNFGNPVALKSGPYKKWKDFNGLIFGKQKSERDHLIRSLSKNLDNKADDELLRILENYEAVMGDEGIAGLKKAYNNETSLTMQKDQQKIVDYINNHLENQKTNPHREIILISGGPGTGKTIVGIRFILEYIKIFNQGKNDNKVIFCLPKSQTVKAVFDSTCAVDEENDREYCCYLQEISKNQNLVVVDEAHRITELEKKLNTVFNKGTKLVILLQDDRQLLRPGEQGTSTAIKDYAIKHNIAFSPSNDKEKEILTLKDEKRCDDSLYQGLIKLFFDDTASINAPISCVSVFNKLSDWEHWQAEMAKTSKTKYIFPFCWAWTSKYDSESNDIKIGSFQKKWNPEDTDEQVMWLNDNSDDRVACIYTSQGLDMDNVAFVWWSDLIWDEHKSKWVTNIKELKDPAFNAKYDNETHVWRQLKWDHKEHKNVLMPDSFSISQDEIDTLIKNTYYVMLSRPRKELGIWFKHEATKKHVLEVLGIKESNR